MKQEWLTGEVFENVFPLPNEVFRLGLRPGELLVYIYLLYRKNLKSGECWPSYSTIGKAVGMTKKTVRKHVCALVDKGLIQTENTTVRWRDGLIYNGNLRYTLKPIKQVLKEREKKQLAELKLAVASHEWAQKLKASALDSKVARGNNYHALNSKDAPGVDANRLTTTPQSPPI